MTTIGWIVSIAAFVVAAVIFFLLGIRYRKNVAEREISSAEEEATRIINEAIKSSENKKREALLEAKEEILKLSFQKSPGEVYQAMFVTSLYTSEALFERFRPWFVRLQSEGRL